MTPPVDPVAEELRRLEESLWSEATRFDPDHMEALLAAGFLEFGRSGRRYDREEVLSEPPAPIGAALPLESFDVRLVRPDVALVTYISDDRTGGPRRANRMSLWEKADGRWRLVFHQGTPVDAASHPADDDSRPDGAVP